MPEDFPVVLTLREAANLLLTTPDVLQSDMEAGRIHGFRVGSEWRTTRQALLNFVGEKPSNVQQIPVNNTNTNTQGVIDMSTLKWEQIAPFTYHWPKFAEQTLPNAETYDPVYQAELRIGTRTVPIKIGFTVRRTSGKDRRRAVVFIKNSPAVEFVGADDFEQTGLLASVIKGKDGKHIRNKEDLPVEYVTMPVNFYTSLVTGSYTAKSVAVVADKDDRTVMARHAFIRAQWKGWLA